VISRSNNRSPESVDNAGSTGRSAAHRAGSLGRAIHGGFTGPPATSGERLLLREITHRINNEFASAIQWCPLPLQNLPMVMSSRAGVRDQQCTLCEGSSLPCRCGEHDDIDASPTFASCADRFSRSNCSTGTIEWCWWSARSGCLPIACWLMGMIVAELITKCGAPRIDRARHHPDECRASGEFIECRVSTTDRHRRLTSGPAAG